MESICNKIKDVNVPTVAALLAISVPGYFVCKNYVLPKLERCEALNMHRSHDKIPSAEDVLEARVRSENIRIGPTFLEHRSYHDRRSERVKSAYSAACDIVNNNLDRGNRCFDVVIEEDDEIVLNVVKRLLTTQLIKDGYVVKVSGNAKLPTRDSTDTESNEKSRFQVFVS